MSVHTGAQASFVYSITLPLVVLEQIAAIEALFVIFNLNKPVWFNALWGIAAVFLGISVLLRREIYPVLRPVPDGYFFASPKTAIGFTILKSVIYCCCLAGLLSVVAFGLKRQRYRKRWPYALSIVLYGILIFNDSFIFQLHRTLYPTTWVASFIFFGLLWREVRWHMQEVYNRLNRDRLTGAASRSFGELYLSQVIKKRSVGLFYADIDSFKEINDTYGHQVGDHVLQQLVYLVQPLMVMPNAIVRLGGDEFLFVFPDAVATDESTLRREIHSLLNGKLKPLGVDEQSHTASLHVSLGWAYGESGSSWMDVIHHADLSMYQQKNLSKL